MTGMVVDQQDFQKPAKKGGKQAARDVQFASFNFDARISGRPSLSGGATPVPSAHVPEGVPALRQLGAPEGPGAMGLAIAAAALAVPGGSTMQPEPELATGPTLSTGEGPGGFVLTEPLQRLAEELAEAISRATIPGEVTAGIRARLGACTQAEVSAVELAYGRASAEGDAEGRGRHARQHEGMVAWCREQGIACVFGDLRAGD
jgi:hypothetical protein